MRYPKYAVSARLTTSTSAALRRAACSSMPWLISRRRKRMPAQK